MGRPSTYDADLAGLLAQASRHIDLMKNEIVHLRDRRDELSAQVDFLTGLANQSALAAAPSDWLEEEITEVDPPNVFHFPRVRTKSEPGIVCGVIIAAA